MTAEEVIEAIEGLCLDLLKHYDVGCSDPELAGRQYAESILELCDGEKR